MGVFTPLGQRGEVEVTAVYGCRLVATVLSNITH